MAAGEGLTAELAGAILDGAPIDWDSAESSADETVRGLVDQLRLLATVADLHRRLPLSCDAPSTAAPLIAAANQVARLEQWAHLRVLEPIGRGAFGEVYRAWDTRLDREVALKLLPAASDDGDSSATSIVEEGRLLARVRHPNVVTIYGAERLEGRLGLWMELVKGRTLEQRLEAGTLFSAADAVKIGVELCHALSAVHDAGVLHRDVKAHNVILADDGRVVLMDFGSGRELNDGSFAGVAGTPLYLAPELLRGKEATVESDIYSLGVLLYHLLTRSYPIQARSLQDLRLAHERQERTSLATARPDLSPKLVHIVERAIHPQGDRYPSANALAADLMAFTREPRVAPLVYALGIAATFVLLAWTAWEMSGRPTLNRITSGASPAISAAATSERRVEQPVIAVLPLKNLGEERDSDYFVDGLTDEIIRNLAVIDGLQVRSSTSSFAFKDKARNVREVGEQLGANLVVEGSVLRSGGRLRINAQLIQVAGDVPLWSERFDRELQDVFAVQDEISRAIVNRLRLTLGRGQRRYDTNLETYDLYLKAHALNERRGAESAKEAAELFRQVIGKDPAFAPAHAGLADAYAFMSRSYYGLSDQEGLSLMRPAAEKALQLDPLLAEAHAAMGHLYSRLHDWQGAQRAFERAIDLNPSLTQIHTAYATTTLIPLGRLDDAERVVLAALRSDPLSLDVRRQLAIQQIIAGKYESALDTLRQVQAVDPDFPFVDLHISRALTFAGRLSEALSLWDSGLEAIRKSGDVRGRQYWMAPAYVMAGRRAEVERWPIGQDEYPYRQAVIYAALGDKDRAFEALDRTAATQPQRLGYILMCPEMAALRGDPRLTALRKKLKLL